MPIPRTTERNRINGFVRRDFFDFLGRGNRGKRKRRGRKPVGAATVDTLTGSRAKPRSLQATDNASRSTSGPTPSRPSTSRPSSTKKKGLLRKIKKSVKKARANLARNRAAKARAKAKKLRGRG